ncbi:MAG: TerD family protein [Candidatus Melainabacteria bacterium]|nr:TerD family protein [Candidatus Melainabacteria bacterium]
MALKLKKSTELPGIKSARVSLTWTGNKADNDLIAIGLTASGDKVGSTEQEQESYVVMYDLDDPSRKVACPNDAIVYSGDKQDSGTEYIDVYFDRLAPEVGQIVLCAAIANWQTTKQTFGTFDSCSLEVTGDGVPNAPIQIDLVGNQSLNTAVVFFKFFKLENTWSAEPVLVGYEEGFEAIAAAYGFATA